MNPSLVALIVSGIAEVIIGFVWYHKHVFGGAWMRLSRITPEAAERAARQRWLRPFAVFLAGALTAFVLGSIGALAGMQTLFGALQFAFLAWAGFTAPFLFVTSLSESRALPFFFINAGYSLVSFIVIALILVIM